MSQGLSDEVAGQTGLGFGSVLPGAGRDVEANSGFCGSKPLLAARAPVLILGVPSAMVPVNDHVIPRARRHVIPQVLALSMST